MTEETPAPDIRFFYVSAIAGRRRYLIAGPYADHATAKGRVEAVLAHAHKVDRSGRAWFMGWGTAGSVEPMKTPLGTF